MTNLPVCPIGQHIEEVRWRSQIIHFCFPDGPSQPLPIDWPMTIAIAVGLGLILAAIVYFGCILIVSHLYKKSRGGRTMKIKPVVWQTVGVITVLIGITMAVCGPHDDYSNVLSLVGVEAGLALIILGPWE